MFNTFFRKIFSENTYFRYGLQAATSFRFVFKANGCPSIVPSHMISFMQPTASVVFASSKKRTVMICVPCSRQLDSARDSACFTFSIMCFFVVPPCTLIYILNENSNNSNSTGKFPTLELHLSCLHGRLASAIPAHC